MGGIYVSVVATGGCSQLQSVMTLEEGALDEPDPAFDYPYGLVSFSLPCGAATITLSYSGGVVLPEDYRKHGPTTPGDAGTTAWYDFPATVIANTVTLDLVDGELGDDTGRDGEIVEPGGPAVAAVPSLPATMLLLLATVLLLGGGLLLRRRVV
jgi:hypothetical protein